MTYNTKNYWVFGLCPSSGILKTRGHSVLETGLFLSSGEWETPTALGPVERAKWLRLAHPHLRTEHRPIFQNVMS
jgi:hypothetical protein